MNLETLSLGMSEKAFSEFITKCGGEANFVGLYTFEVVRKFIIPMTIESKKSYCEQQYTSNKDNNGFIRKASIFISHAWGCNFLDVLNSVRHFMHNNEQHEAVWFDIFSYNQHLDQNSQQETEYLQNHFRAIIERLGHTVMILAPWDDPIPLRRAWCLYEIYSTVDTHSQFDLAMTEKEKQRFFKEICVHGQALVDQMISNVNAERSQCGKLEDQIRILGLVRNTIGFHKINTLIFDLIRDWILKTIKLEAFIQKQRKNSDSRLQLMYACANLYHGAGLINEAENLYSEYIEEVQTIVSMVPFSSPSDSLEVLKGLSGLALVYRDQGKYTEATTLYQRCIQTTREKFGLSNPLTAEAMINLAMLYRYQGKYQDAVNFYEECIRYYLKLPSNQNTLLMITSLKHNLASIYQDQTEYALAEQLYLECYKYREQVLGAEHPLTLALMDDIGLLYRRMKDYPEAVNYYERCLSVRAAKLGVDHPDTLASMSGLASVYRLQIRYSEAFQLSHAALISRRRKLGSDHPTTINTYGNLGMVKYEQASKVCNCRSHIDCLFTEEIGLCGKYMIMEVLMELRNRGYSENHVWIVKFTECINN